MSCQPSLREMPNFRYTVNAEEIHYFSQKHSSVGFYFFFPRDVMTTTSIGIVFPARAIAFRTMTGSP